MAGTISQIDKCIVPWGHKYNYFDYCTECGGDRPW